jgi:hypothetical protein
MRASRLLSCLAFIALALSHEFQRVTVAQDVAAVTIGDVRNAVHELEDTISSLSVRCTFSGVTQMPSDSNITVQLRNVETSTVDKSGRARCEIDGQSAKVVAGKAVIRPSKRISTFDGSLCRSASGVTSTPAGLITKSRSDLGWTLDPLEMTTHYYQKPVSHIIADRKGKIVGRAMHDGDNVFVVETEPITNKKLDWNYRFLIDPKLNFAVVRRSQLLQFPSHKGWIEFDYIDSLHHREVSPGVWFPSQVVVRTTDPTEEDARTGSKPRLAWEWNVENENWILNPRAADSFFTLEFPPGTTVEEKVNGRRLPQP